MLKLVRFRKVIVLVVLAIILGTGIFWKVKSSQPAAQTLQTATIEKGTLVVSVAASGQVSTANSAQVTTEASGVITKLFVENGQKVNSGDAVAQLELDMEGRQRNSQALASYQSAQNSMYSLQSTMLTKWKTYMDSAQSSSYQNADGSAKTDNRQLPQFVSTSDDWLSTEAAYKNQQNTINQTYLAYLQASPIIYAPISGTVTGLGLQVGSVVTAQSNSSGGSSAQKIASVVTAATPTITVNLTEIDVPKVKIGDKVTVTLDAFSDKTYTGIVISIDTVGAVSSGVTTYPTVIKLDTQTPEILTNMSAQAKIITNVKNDVLLVPTSAISNGTVRILKNNQPQTVTVEVGLTSGTQTEIISGLSEGDTVVTSAATTTTQRNGSTTSVFGSFGGSGAARIIGR